MNLSNNLTIAGIIITIIGIIAGTVHWLIPKESFTGLFKKYSIKTYIEKKNLRQNFKVAIIDDEIENYPIKYLEALGFTVNKYESVSFADSPELIKNDLLLLDVKGVVIEDLEEGGAKLIKIIKEARPHIPVIAVSSGYFHPELNDYFKSSDAILNKPIKEYKIREVLNELKKEFFDVSSIASGIEREIKNLELSSSKKNKLNKFVIDFISKKCDDSSFINFVHQNAMAESQGIISNSRILRDRIENA